MICPSCQQDVNVTEHNYGALYTCGSCQAVYFINFEGQPEYGEVLAEAPVEESVPREAEAPLPEETFESSLEPLIDSVNVVSTDPGVDSSLPGEILSDLTSSEAENISEEVPGYSENSFADAAREISNFGNMEVQLSGLNYHLQVNGLDTQEVIRLFKEAIEDSRFGWDANELMQNVKNGHLRFESLSPVKAYILAKRLQFLDIEKQWEQNVLS